MMKKNSILVFLTMLGLTGCNGAKLSDLANALQEEFGITVELKTPDTDECATEQAAQFVQDYKALSGADQNSVKGALMAKYKTIIVSPTSLTQTVSGNAYTVAIKADHGMVSHVIADELKFEGVAPKTQLATKADQLMISTQDALHKETNTTAWALNPGVYQSVASPADFHEAVRLGALNNVQVSDAPTFSCGDLAHLKDIL
jgi:hypothetical protein